MINAIESLSEVGDNHRLRGLWDFRVRKQHVEAVDQAMGGREMLAVAKLVRIQFWLQIAQKPLDHDAFRDFCEMIRQRYRTEFFQGWRSSFGDWDNCSSFPYIRCLYLLERGIKNVS